MAALAGESVRSFAFRKARERLLLSSCRCAFGRSIPWIIRSGHRVAQGLRSHDIVQGQGLAAGRVDWLLVHPVNHLSRLLPDVAKMTKPFARYLVARCPPGLDAAGLP
jgi:hypothetical protein